MGSRFKDRELGALEADERGGAEAGAACGVGCLDVGNFCEGAGCRSAGPNGVISSEATSGGEASTCLRAFCCGTFSSWLLLIVLSPPAAPASAPPLSSASIALSSLSLKLPYINPPSQTGDSNLVADKTIDNSHREKVPQQKDRRHAPASRLLVVSDEMTPLRPVKRHPAISQKLPSSRPHLQRLLRHPLFRLL